MAVAFDTLEHASRLERAGFTREQAAAQVQALVAIVTDNLVTKHDLHELRLAMQRDFHDFRAEMRHEWAEMRREWAEMRNEWAGVRNDWVGVRNDWAGVRNEWAGVRNEWAEMRHEWAEFRTGEWAEFRAGMERETRDLRHGLREVEHRLTVRLGGMLAVAVGAVAALVKLL